MQLPKFKFIQANSLKEACSILVDYSGKAVILAGGTSLIVSLRYGLCKPDVVIGLKGLTTLDYINKKDNGEITIGSMVTLETLSKSPLIVKEHPWLSQATQLIAVLPIRQKATIGGNLCLNTRCIYYNQSELWRSGQEACFKRGGNVCHAVENSRRCQAVYQGDLAPLLIALGAEVKIVSKNSERMIPLADFFTARGENPNLMKGDEILVEVKIPPFENRITASYEKLRVREGMEFPMAGVAVMLKKDGNETIENARLVLGAVGSSPIILSEAGRILEGQKLTEDLIQSVSKEGVEKARPVANLSMDANYRKKMIGVLIKRALRRAMAIKPQG